MLLSLIKKDFSDNKVIISNLYKKLKARSRNIPIKTVKTLRDS